VSLILGIDPGIQKMGVAVYDPAAASSTFPRGRTRLSSRDTSPEALPDLVHRAPRDGSPFHSSRLSFPQIWGILEL